MVKHHLPKRFTSRSALWSRLALAAALSAAAVPAGVLAQAPAASAAVAAEASPEQLEQLVGRIALYPDDLVSVILPASTNPLQIVQADRFLESRKANPKAAIDPNWDDAVKTLTNYPEVVKSMSADLDWTAALGEAVVADAGAVLEAVQAFRRRAQSTGNLKSDSRQTVVVEKEVITIAPADPQVIYVPQYNPSTVVVAGSPYWGYYPAPYPSYYYPYAPGAALATGLIWGAAMGAIWSGGRYASHYGGGGNNNINIDRSNNINTGNRNNVGSGNRGGNSATQWKSNKQPGQVSSGVGGARQAQGRTGDAGRGGAGGAGGGNFGGGGGAGAGAGARGGGGAGAGAGGGAGGGGGAFQGYSSGRQTQMDSSRGASSRSSPSPSSGARAGGGGGGGARAGGGGGGGGRGGGGGGRGGGGGGRR